MRAEIDRPGAIERMAINTSPATFSNLLNRRYSPVVIPASACAVASRACSLDNELLPSSSPAGHHLLRLKDNTARGPHRNHTDPMTCA